MSGAGGSYVPGGFNMSPDFKRGFMVAAGVLVAMYVIGTATGIIKKVI